MILNGTYESASNLQLFISPVGSRKRIVSPVWINPSTMSRVRASGLHELWVAAKRESSLDILVPGGIFGNPGPLR